MWNTNKPIGITFHTTKKHIHQYTNNKLQNNQMQIILFAFDCFDSSFSFLRHPPFTNHLVNYFPLLLCSDLIFHFPFRQHFSSNQILYYFLLLEIFIAQVNGSMIVFFFFWANVKNNPIINRINRGNNVFSIVYFAPQLFLYNFDYISIIKDGNKQSFFSNNLNSFRLEIIKK